LQRQQVAGQRIILAARKAREPHSALCQDVTLRIAKDTLSKMVQGRNGTEENMLLHYDLSQDVVELLKLPN